MELPFGELLFVSNYHIFSIYPFLIQSERIKMNIENIKDFREELMDALGAFVDEETEVCPCDVQKNNGVVLCGILIKRPGKNVTPSIYLEQFYDEYRCGGDIDDIAKKVIELDEKSRDNIFFDADFYTDFDKVKSHLFVKMISRKNNEKLIKDIPYREFLDLIIAVYCDVSDMCQLEATILVRNEHLERWEIDREELIDIAYDNTKRVGCQLRDIVEIAGEIKGDEAIEAVARDVAGRMFVMNNTRPFFGAICMTYDDMLDEFLECSDNGVYIIPSSIHEVILVSEEFIGKEPQQINQIIEYVNSDSLSAEEVLSEHAYYYSKQDGYACV